MRILAATDGSRYSLAAIRCAAWLSSKLPLSRLDIVLVGDAEASFLEGPALTPRTVRTMKDEYRRWARQALTAGAREAARFRRPARVHYAKARRLEPIAAVIGRVASSLGADLLVVGAHGRGAVGRALLGSVARRLVAIARVPVVVVPTPFSHFRRPLRIAAATDGSRASTMAIRAAAGLVRRAHGRLEIVTASTLKQDLALFSSPVLSFVPYSDLARSEERAARRILLAGERAARSAGVRPELRFVEPRRAQPVAHVLADWAVRRGAHLLAVGLAGRGALEGWLLGSVTRRVLSVSRRPVLVVGKASRVSRRGKQ